jgi:hypothetical protein
MALFEVGKPYRPDRARWPEATQYSFRGGAHELLLFWGQLDAGVVEAVRSGRLDTSVLERGPVILFLYKIEGACGWSDAPFSWHRVAPVERVSPERPVDGERALLHLTLVECETGLVRVLRAASLSSAQTALLHAAIARQAALPAEPADYDREFARIQAAYTCRQLAEMGERGKGGS